LDKAPNPRETGKSGYPHRYKDKGGLFKRSDTKNSNSGSRSTSSATSVASSTTSLYEYPVQRDGNGYNFNSKPKGSPGPFRTVTNQNKRLKGVMCHNGDLQTMNTNKGFFHLC
ncbi:Ribonuclease/ribotoxin, partial [Cenococcum geophilum]